MAADEEAGGMGRGQSGESGHTCLLRHPIDCTCPDGMFAADPVGHLVVVEWEDTTNIAAWQDRAEVREFAKDGSWRCQNVGWVQVFDEDCIVLSARRTNNSQHLGLTERIPRRAILNISRASVSGGHSEGGRA